MDSPLRLVRYLAPTNLSRSFRRTPNPALGTRKIRRKLLLDLFDDDHRNQKAEFLRFTEEDSNDILNLSLTLYKINAPRAV